MTITPEEYKRKIVEAYPDEVLKGMMLAVGTGYSSAPEHCKRHFDAEDRHDLIGRVRRARIHENVRGVGERFAEKYGIKVKDVPNSNGSTFFLCLISGEMRLVCCLIPTRQSMIRPAKIRKMWAHHNFDGQEGLFPNGDEVPIRLEHLAVLVHSPAGRHKNQAAFVDVVIPDRHFSHYNERIPLFEMFPKEAEEYRAMFKQKKRRGEGTA